MIPASAGMEEAVKYLFSSDSDGQCQLMVESDNIKSVIGFKKIILGFQVGWGERSEPQLNQDVGVHSVHPNLPKIIILKDIVTKQIPQVRFCKFLFLLILKFPILNRHE